MKKKKQSLGLGLGSSKKISEEEKYKKQYKEIMTEIMEKLDKEPKFRELVEKLAKS